jgi:two-component system OmpR family response regulator
VPLLHRSLSVRAPIRNHFFRRKFSPEEMVFPMPTILVVDDNLAIRSLLLLGLKKEGVTVLSAADGIRALEIYRENAERIDLVLLDMEMPGLDGPKTFVALQKIDPEVRCCFLTGHSGYSAETAASLGAIAIFGKPILSLRNFSQELVRLTCPEYA